MVARQSVDPAIIEGVQQHLQALKKTPDGVLLFSLIERGLQRYGTQGRIEHAFLTFVNSLLRKYVHDPKSDPVTRFKAKLIQSRLSMYSPTAPAHAEPASSTVAEPDLAPAAVAVVVGEPPAPAVAAARPITEAPASADESADGLAQLERSLAKDVAATITHNEDLDRLLQRNIAVFEQMGNKNNLNDIQTLLFTGLEQLIQGHQQLGANLQRASDYLKLIQTDRDQLQRQLRHARKFSLVDEPTGLPNRTAMVRQLTSEIGRAKRHGGGVALALIAIDEFESFKRRHGDEIVGRVLSAYGAEVFSVFRAYDVAARYGEDSFAVVFPNTDVAGALRAVEKALFQANNGRLSLRGGELPLPSFSAVIAVHSANEKAATLLRRTDEALTRLTQSGRGSAVITLDGELNGVTDLH